MQGLATRRRLPKFGTQPTRPRRSHGLGVAAASSSACRLQSAIDARRAGPVGLLGSTATGVMGASPPSNRWGPIHAALLGSPLEVASRSAFGGPSVSEWGSTNWPQGVGAERLGEGSERRVRRSRASRDLKGATTRLLQDR
eukprot:3866379-Pyramimonas_sp.AAC.1